MLERVRPRRAFRSSSVLTERTHADLNGPFPVSGLTQPEVREFGICLLTDSRKENSEKENI